MHRYDPLRPPDPDAWLAIDEAERIELVRQYHQRARVRLPNATAHAVTHVIVENQIALGDEIPVRQVAERLMAEGLDRHEAVHAIGCVLMDVLNEGLTAPGTDADLSDPYYARLAALTVDSWRRDYG